MCASLCARAFSNILDWISFRSSSTFVSSSSRLTTIFSPVSRRARTAWLASISFGPISTRTGIPRISASANFQPGLLSVASSLTLNPLNLSLNSSAFSRTPSLCWAIGITITCVGAIIGGRTRPLSSPWTIIIAPIRRVVIPQDVWWTYCSLFSLSVYWMPKALAKPSPKLWLVPDWRALPSCINASMV